MLFRMFKGTVSKLFSMEREQSIITKNNLAWEEKPTDRRLG